MICAKKFLIFSFSGFLLFGSLLSFGQRKELTKPKYSVEDGAIVGHNVGSYNNRPLYINNTSAFILTGDQPISRLAQDQFLYGTFMLFIERDGKGKWLQQCDQITSIFRPDRMAWEIADPAFPGLKISLEILPMATTTGMAVHAKAEGIEEGDSLVWAYGGLKWYKDQNLSWKLDVMGQPELLTWGFDPENCKYNVVDTASHACLVSLTDSTPNHNILFTVAGRCSSATGIKIGEASAWDQSTLFKTSQIQALPILCGKVALEKGKAVYWAFKAADQDGNSVSSMVSDPEIAFTEGVKRAESLQYRLKINTPDPYLNAVAQISVAAVDGTWYPPVFHHGAMQWNIRLPGWRTIFGGTMYGWHDRVKAEARFYTDAQIKESDKKEAKADPALLMTGQHPDSRFYGTGRIDKDQNFYDMQSQFFDQIIEEWRFTADSELESFLRRALGLHLIWMRDCFDPDGDGVYESYLNTWPTDSQWYNGGGTAEENFRVPNLL